MNAATFGTGMAALCAVHCLALPVLAGASCCTHDTPLGQPLVEAGMIGTAGIIGFATLGVSYLQHRRPLPLSLLAVGLVTMVGAHAWLSGAAGTVASVFGALLLVAAQLLNRRCPAACCTDHSPAHRGTEEQEAGVSCGTPAREE